MKKETSVNNSNREVHANLADTAHSVAAPHTRRPTWEETEGNPLPLGVKWIEEEQAFNFAVHSEHAENVTLLLYSPADLVNPLLRLQLDFLHNKSGRIWHCRVALPSPVDFSDDGIPLEQTKYLLPPRSIVVLCRPKKSDTRQGP